MSISKHAWINRDNQFILRYDATASGGSTAPADLSLVSALVMEFRESGGGVGPVITVAKDEVAAVINWWDGTLGVGEMLFKLGLSTETFTPDETYKCRITLTTASSPNGIVWTSWGDSSLTSMSVTFFETA
jgi:hypothetical protein